MNYQKKHCQVNKRKAMGYVILYTCFTVHGFLAFKSGLILLYLKSFNIPDSRILAYLAIPSLSLAILRVPGAYLADRIGKKVLAAYGICLGCLGYIIISFAGNLDNQNRETAVLAGIIIFSIGTVLTGAGWFPLLDPIIPKGIRGRFLGRMRLSWQIIGFIFSAISSWVLKYYTNISAFQTLLFAIAIMLLIRGWFYWRIPELEKPSKNPHRENLFSVLVNLIRTDGYTTFGAYIFLLTFFTSYCPTIFSMMEKEVLKLDNSMVIWLANLAMIGAIAGFWVGGQAVDRMGTKPVFLICHGSYFTVIVLFIFRAFIPGAMMPVLWISHLLFGIIAASSSIAITTEIFALMQQKNKAVGVSVLMSFLVGGGALAGFVAAAIIKLGFLKENWLLLEMKMNQYDSILCASAVMILMLVTTLGLVPSVLRKSQLIPQSPPQ
jgi:MFS family permease